MVIIGQKWLKLVRKVIQLVETLLQIGRNWIKTGRKLVEIFRTWFKTFEKC
jgi:hypothetical protein